MQNLVQEAREHLRHGRARDAEALFARVLEREPAHVEALNVMGLAALRDAAAPRAVEFLERAVCADAADPLSHHLLGRARETAGDFAGALTCQEMAVRLRPDFVMARLTWAVLLERSLAMDQAVVQYARALGDAQKVGLWLNPDTTPPALRPVIEHAVIVVREHRAAAFARLFDPLVTRFGPASLDRISQTLRIYFNQESPHYPDPRQRPSFLFMPGLPASPYIDRAALPWIEAFESQTTGIQAELQRVLPHSEGVERVFSSADLERENLRGGEASWTGYYFFRHGERRDENCARCPATAAALEHLPLSRVRGHGPEVLYSVFSPGTELLPHRGVTNTRLVGHLPLIVPAGCALRVGNEIHEWQEGRAVVFDDTYEHEAWNRSGSTRVVLIFDIWNPYLSEIERAALGELIGAIGDFRETMAQG